MNNKYGLLPSIICHSSIQTPYDRDTVTLVDGVWLMVSMLPIIWIQLGFANSCHWFANRRLFANQWHAFANTPTVCKKNRFSCKRSFGYSSCLHTHAHLVTSRLQTDGCCLQTHDGCLQTRDGCLQTRISTHPPGSCLQTHAECLQTHTGCLQILDSRLQTHDSRLQTNDGRLSVMRLDLSVTIGR